MTAFSLFVTFTFGYMTVAYLIGSKLNRVQLISLTTAYLLAAFTSALVGQANLTAMRSMQQELQNSAAYQRTMFLDAEIYLALFPILCIGGIFMSLYLMYDIRKTPVTE